MSLWNSGHRAKLLEMKPRPAGVELALVLLPRAHPPCPGVGMTEQGEAEPRCRSRTCAINESVDLETRTQKLVVPTYLDTSFKISGSM